MDASVGLIIQCVGIVLVTLVSFFLMRSIQTRALRYWTLAWTCLTLALASLTVAFFVARVADYFYTLYFLGEYLFGLAFAVGCRQHATGRAPARRVCCYSLVPFALLALLLPYVSSDFNDLFIVQAAVMAGLFATALFALRPAWRRNPTPGVQVMSVALLLLALDFFLYVGVFGAHHSMWAWIVPDAYLKFTSIFDLLLEILLGFGTVMVLMEGVRREVEATNLELTAARDRLELMARVDPLTQAFNRHAFHSLLDRAPDASSANAAGCVVVIDIDNLKPINDTHGHAAGDEAIRAVAHAVRALIRADDMLFRWGGDEFLLLLFGLHEATARARLATLNDALAATRLQRVATPVGISVSYGLAPFAALADLQQAIEQADTRMYRRKQDYKAQQSPTVAAVDVVAARES